MKKGWMQVLLDCLFPLHCVGCRTEGVWCCLACCQTLPLLREQLCPVCSTPIHNGAVCESCKQVSYLDGVTALFQYRQSNEIGLLIQDYKYNFCKDIERALPSIIASAHGLQIATDYIAVPVPLHEQRERKRGFNQAQGIANTLATLRGISVQSHLLRRARHTKQQMTLSREARLANVQYAFAISDQSKVPPRVLLVDDVFTTGATMQACAKILKDNGARAVWGFVLARD